MGRTREIPFALRWDDGEKVLWLLDQRLLPGETKYLKIQALSEVREAIAAMVVRGAPAIGVAAAYGMALAAFSIPEDKDTFFPKLSSLGSWLAGARPTAVNLSWAVNRMLACGKRLEGQPVPAVQAALLREAKEIHREDILICRRIGESLLPRLRDGMGILTHCNAGQLATSQYGTALSPIYLALEAGMRLTLFADETRPRLQGSMLTAYELSSAGADVTVICDNMAASLMAAGKIDCCIVGCDRVARNGDTANKIGTLNVAILAKHFGIPFYVAAPTPTIDMACFSGEDIPIEERDGEEVSSRFGVRTVPEGVAVFNPAFDVTPHGLITAFVTEYGLLMPPFDKAFEGCDVNPKGSAPQVQNRKQADGRIGRAYPVPDQPEG